MIEEVIVSKQNPVIGLATGSTPIGAYNELVDRYKRKQLDFSKVTSFNLDEYYGLDPSNHQSYRYFMDSNLFNHINISKEKTHVPNGLVNNPNGYGREYDELIEEHGGIDIQLLGIGRNGHIAFNEPADELRLSTHLVDLTEDTIEANSRFFESKEEVPTKAITMGMGTILKAKKIVLMAEGEQKAKIMADLISKDQISTKLPASFLRLHRDFTIVLDSKAAKYL